MVSKEELAQLDLQYRSIANQRLMLEQRVAELKLAQDYLKDHDVDKVYKTVGPVLVELPKDQALKEIEQDLESSQLSLNIVKKKEEDLKKELESKVNEYLKGRGGA